MSFWLNEQRILTYVRWVPTSVRISFFAGILGLMAAAWLFFLFIPQRKVIKSNFLKCQILQENIGILFSQLSGYEKLALLDNKNLLPRDKYLEPIRWADAFEQIGSLLSAENLVCKKIKMLKDKPGLEINSKTVEYVFTGRYAHVVNFLKKIQHQFSHMQIVFFSVDKAEKNAVLVTLRICLLDV